MRLFIAIPVSGKLKDIVLLLQQCLDKKIFRLTKSEQIHITIAFLGEVNEKSVPDIINELKKIRFNSFKLKTKKFGFFPSEEKIRVVWIGLEENKDFFKLQYEIRKIFNFKEKLMPHITIARAKEIIISKNKKENYWKKKMFESKYDEIEFIVDKFVLFESIPTPEGHVYKELEVFKSIK